MISRVRILYKKQTGSERSRLLLLLLLLLLWPSWMAASVAYPLPPPENSGMKKYSTTPVMTSARIA